MHWAQCASQIWEDKQLLCSSALSCLPDHVWRDHEVALATDDAIDEALGLRVGEGCRTGRVGSRA